MSLLNGVMLALLWAGSAQDKASSQGVSKEKKDLMKKAIDDLRRSDILKKAIKKGDSAPQFILNDVHGKKVSLKELLKNGPIVLTFYRGVWCPICNKQLSSYQGILPKIRAAGAELVAVSPELPDSGIKTEEKNKITFTILTDSNNRVATNYGLVFKLNDKIKKLYKEYGIDLQQNQGNEEWQLPIPATYVIGRNGKIKWAFLDVDYKNRATTDDILKALNN